MQSRLVNILAHPGTLAAALAAFTLLAAGCKHQIAVDPIEVRPIHMTLDINLKVDRELDEFFDFEETAATTQPADAPTSTAPADATAPQIEAAVEGGTP